MGPKAVELAGRFADGWHALMLTPDGIRERLADFERGGDLGDRNRADQRVTLSVPCCALEDGDRARELAAQHLAFYVGGMGTFYREALSAQGYEDLAHDVAQKWANRDREAATSAIAEHDILDDMAAVGTPAECRERFEAFAGIEGIDAVSVSFPRGADAEDRHATLDALTPE
jgi:alkanesulfonate monooxygenase SsuD/methylene tetrahydromethanopterin reductase-like flavin-dependent oxidoreductase (luciferase family)